MTAGNNFWELQLYKKKQLSQRVAPQTTINWLAQAFIVFLVDDAVDSVHHHCFRAVEEEEEEEDDIIVFAADWNNWV